MRATFRVVCITLVAAVIVSASPCASGTLSSYIALGGTGCTVGTTLFNNFASLPIPFGATQINPAGVTVTPLDTLYHPALTFGIGAFVNGDFADIDIGFNASSPPAKGLIAGSQVTLIAPSFTDSGSVTAIHDACPSGTFSGGVCSTSDFNAIAIASDAFTDLSEGTSFSPASNASFMTDIGVDGTGGAASLRSVSVTVNTVPEPAQLGFLSGAGLAAVLFFRRRRRASPGQ